MKVLLISFISLWSLSALAVNINQYNHSHSPTYLLTEDTLTLNSIGKNQFILSSYYNYVKDPLITTNSDKTEKSGTAIDGMSSYHFGVGYQTSSRMLIGVSSFASKVWKTGDFSEFSLGDTKVMAKYRMTGRYALNSFAVITEFELPTGDESLFIGQGGAGLGIKLAYERDFSFFKINANIGYMRNSSAIYKDLDYRNKILIALGGHIPFGDKIGLVAEAQTVRTLPFNTDQNPGEVYLGARYTLENNLTINGGLSLGLMDKFDSNEYKLLVGLKFTPKTKARFPTFTSSQRKIIREILRINDEINFNHDSAIISADAKTKLTRIANLIKEGKFDFKRIQIEGHASRIGPSAYNEFLSKKRAQNVSNFLATKGVNLELLDNVAKGENELVFKNNIYSKDLSRRVEFNVIR